jgi:hypothetical protein
MTQSHQLDAFYATTSVMRGHRVKSTTSGVLEAAGTLPQSLVYAQNIIAVTRASMGLATRDLRSTMASVSMSYST